MEAARAENLQQRQLNADNLNKSDMTVYELQSYMVNYEDKGVFDDFNEMAIQYGLVWKCAPVYTPLQLAECLSYSLPHAF